MSKVPGFEVSAKDWISQIEAQIEADRNGMSYTPVLFSSACFFPKQGLFLQRSAQPETWVEVSKMRQAKIPPFNK